MKILKMTPHSGVQGHEGQQQHHMRDIEQSNSRPDEQSREVLELPEQRHGWAAPRDVGDNGDDERAYECENHAAHDEEPRPARAQRDGGRQDLSDDAGHQEGGRHRADRPRPTAGSHRLRQVGQGNGCESGGRRPLESAQHREHRQRRDRRAREGRRREHSDRHHHHPLPPISIRDRPPDEESERVRRAEARRESERRITAHRGADGAEQRDGGIQLREHEERRDDEDGDGHPVRGMGRRRPLPGTRRRAGRPVARSPSSIVGNTAGRSSLDQSLDRSHGRSFSRLSDPAARTSPLPSHPDHLSPTGTLEST